MRSIVMTDWLREHEQRKLREAREFARGFWYGALGMGVVLIGVVIFAIATR